MSKDKGFSSLSSILQNKSAQTKPPAYQWQDLALEVIKELNIPNFKRNSVFKICKENDRGFVEKCMNDTKELAKDGEQWRYFFKLINQK